MIYEAEVSTEIQIRNDERSALGAIARLIEVLDTVDIHSPEWRQAWNVLIALREEVEEF